MNFVSNLTKRHTGKPTHKGIKAASKPLSQNRWFNIGFWVVQAALALMFIMAGASKLLGVSEMVTLFENVGMGQWLRYLTGILEIAAAFLLIIPSFVVFGGLLLAGVMAGAILSHLFIIGGSPLIPCIFLILSLLVIWGRRKR